MPGNFKHDFLEISSTKIKKVSHELDSAWSGHTRFAYWFINYLKPKTFVELGTHYGESFFAFCQSVHENNLNTKTYAVDTWQGDPHSGYYSEEIFEIVQSYHEKYSNFATLIRSTFDRALHKFDELSIDLLHIDGLHTYEAIRHDFETWLPKIKEGGVILFHDICATHDDFGVWKLWNELIQQYPNTQFNHSWGLGILVNNLDQSSSDIILKINELKELFEFLNENDLKITANNNELKVVRNQLITEVNSIVRDKDNELEVIRNQLKSKDEELNFQQTQINRLSDILFQDYHLRPKNPIRKWTSRKLKSLDALLPKPVLPINKLHIAFSKKEAYAELKALLDKGHFNAAWYLSKYPEIVELNIDPFYHYLKYGWKEGKDPSPSFNVTEYLNNNPAVKNAGIEPLTYYLKYGNKNNE